MSRAPIIGIRIGQGYGTAIPHSRELFMLGYRILECCICRATWAGPEGEECEWCIHRNGLA